MGTINRSGTVSFADASLSIWEEGSPCREQWDEWEKNFKKQVFARIVQTLNRLGYTCVVPDEMVKQYSLSFARNHRFCQKGDLKADLRICGRCIELKFFQSVNCHERHDHEGRYEPDKERAMPYVIWLEMERTRRRIRDYLCNVFGNYEFSSKHHDGRNNKRGPGHLTAMDWVRECYETSCHFKGDVDAYPISKQNRKSADDGDISHGMRVWFFDRKGRIGTGIAYYNINNMWWVVTGKYGVNNLASHALYTSLPDNYRTKRNGGIRRIALEKLLAKAIGSLDFELAATLRDILFPKGSKLFVVIKEEEQLYHRPGFCGYTRDINEAGKFTEDEVKGWDRSPNKVIELRKAA